MKAAIWGATGAAGIEFVRALVNHPWFEITAVYASDKSAGKTLEEACVVEISDVPMQLRKMIVRRIDEVTDIDFLCSALPSEIAREYEGKYAAHYPIISTTSAFRYEKDVPILITEVNSTHDILLEAQKKRGWKGWIAPGPNCTTVGLVMSLYPLLELGIKRVTMSSYQSVSGGGYSLLKKWEEQHAATLPLPEIHQEPLDQPPLTLEGNVLGYIKKEEEKVKTETRKILGRLSGYNVYPVSFALECSCVRVPTLQGHFETVFVDMEKKCTVDNVKELYERFNATSAEKFSQLPSSPRKTITVLDRAPQPRFDSFADGGMSTIIGRIEKTEQGIKYQVLSNNTVKGAAKGMIQVAEYLMTRGWL